MLMSLSRASFVFIESSHLEGKLTPFEVFSGPWSFFINVKMYLYLLCSMSLAYYHVVLLRYFQTELVYKSEGRYDLTH